MLRRIALLLVILSSVVVIGCATTQTVPTGPGELTSIEIFEYGLYKKNKRMHSGKPHRETHYIKYKSSKFVNTTDKVPAKLNTMFGVKFYVNRTPKRGEVSYTVKWIHPPLQNPEVGKTITSQTYKGTARAGKDDWSSSIYKFDNDWELVPGEWIFQVFFEGRLMAKKTFTVYKP